MVLSFHPRKMFLYIFDSFLSSNLETRITLTFQSIFRTDAYRLESILDHF